MTGTPAPNGLLDLWAQVFLLDSGERLGKKIGGFRERYFEPDQRSRDRVFSYAPKESAEETVQSLIGDICVSMKAEDYLELPDITYNTIPVLLDDKAQNAYDKLEKEMLLQVDDSTIDAGSAAVLTNKLLQLCNGAVYDAERNIVPIHDCKIEAFLELIEGLNGKPAIVFYAFKHDKERIKKALAKSGLRIRGLDTDQDQVDWNNREVDILLAHPASAAYGLNLQQGGNHVIWFGLNWSLELYQQANKRLLILVSIFYGIGSGSAKTDLNGEKVKYEKIVDEIKSAKEDLKTYNAKVKEIQSKIKTVSNDYAERKTEFDEAKKIAGQKESILGEIASYTTDLDTKKKESSSLDTDINTKKDELASIGNAIVEKKTAPIQLPAGQFVVGKDIPAGRYKVLPIGRGSNFMVDDSSGNNVINTIIYSDSNLGVTEYVTLLSDGYIIDAHSPFKYIPVE